MSASHIIICISVYHWTSRNCMALLNRGQSSKSPEESFWAQCGLCVSSAHIWLCSHQLLLPGELLQLVSHSQRYPQIPADKTIICSTSPWFRSSGRVWCLPLVSWLKKDGWLQIPEAPYVFLPYHPAKGPDRSLLLHKSLLQVESKVSTKCQALHQHTCGGGLLARCERPLWCATAGTCGKMFKLDTNTGEPEQVKQKRTLQYEVIVLVGLRWQHLQVSSPPTKI